ncbi:hypothetical protein [Bosea sp. PAMC 26642]|uniref:hypothetical protein n=1 Tax=Bosea sp. (strain PAMC 26642) TaxID=1792307 RepID=UPI000AB46CDD|nr:hypothetical protein [Bosea sp. PAMC 26642]
MIEAAMFIVLGFLSASLMALAAVPALSRRADRLARRRAEAAFPLSLAEIAADRDHLRAELAMRERALELRAESGFAAKAGAMEEIGRRDMTIGRLERDLRERESRIAVLVGDLSETRADLEGTQAALAAEKAGHAETSERLDRRVADLASVEHSLAETRAALTGTSADLDSRSNELAQERATLGRVEAILAEREQDLAKLRSDADALRVVQVENRTQILVLEGKRDELASRLTSMEQHLEEALVSLRGMTVDRDSERLRADTLAARAMQAETELAAAEVRTTAALAEVERTAAQLSLRAAAIETERLAKEELEQRAGSEQSAWQDERLRLTEELAALHADLREREGRLEVVHAEALTLQGSLAQARADRARLKREVAELRRQPAGATGDNAALRQEILRVAERLMALPPAQEAAE